MAHLFLSDEWIDEARKLRAEYRGRSAPFPHAMRVNLVVTEVPFDSGQVLAYLDTSEGDFDIETGQLDRPDLKVTVDYATAKALLVEGNPQAGMQAFMTGKIQVEGDMAKLLALQGTTPDPTAQEMAERLRAITA
jgi:hypothetical protein